MERLKNKLTSWKARVLSYAGRTTLLQAVASSTPSYTMASNDLGPTVCKNMDSMMRDFWWGKCDDKKGIYLKSWRSVYSPKCLRGLGIRRMHEFNQALHSKMAWQLFSNSSKLWVKLLLGKYCRRHSFLHVKPQMSDSPMWKEILHDVELIEKGGCYYVGKGNKIRVWVDPWVPELAGFKPRARDEADIIVFRVDDCIANGTWITELVRDQFDEESANAILKIPNQNPPSEDKLIWIDDKMGDYSVKRAYKILLNDSIQEHANLNKDFWKSVWSLSAPQRVRIFIWRVAWNAIPTLCTLQIRINNLITSCPMCDNAHETTEHLFFECPFGRTIWLNFMGLRMENFPSWSLSIWLENCFLKGGAFFNGVMDFATHAGKAAFIIDNIWWQRNQKVHDNIPPNPIDTLNLIKKRWIEWSEPERSLETTPNNDSGGSLSRLQVLNGTHFVVDAAIGSESSIAAWVRTDEEGTFVEGGAMKVDSTVPFMVEAKAIWLAISTMETDNISGGIIYSDALTVVEEVLKGPPFPWRSSHILSSISLIQSILATSIVFTLR